MSCIRNRHFLAADAGRRGVAGTLVVMKIAGAAAQSGAPLQECKRLGDKANQSTATFGVALGSCSVPGAAEDFLPQNQPPTPRTA